MALSRVCIYCGSSSGARPAYEATAIELGRRLGERGIGVVYGGASVGLMGAVADAALAAGSEVIGVIPRALMDRELGHSRVSELRVVESMHERKALMAELADGFVALPGGLGTLEELFEILTWAQLGFHASPVAVLDTDGYYTPLLRFLDDAVEAGFIRPAYRALLGSADTPDALLDLLHSHTPLPQPQWLHAGET